MARPRTRWLLGTGLRSAGLVIAGILAPVLAAAQECPAAAASLSTARIAINEMAKKARPTPAAECAKRWTSGLTLTREKLGDPTLISFFAEAADMQRRAYEVRKAARRDDLAGALLDTEIDLRRRWIKEALGGPPLEDPVRKATIRHLSALAGALALRQKFVEIADVLSNTEPYVIDEAAVSVWLQAVFSCASFDGNGSASKLCTPETMKACRDRITSFLESVDQMKGRQYPPQTTRDLRQLRALSTDTRCEK